MDISRPAGWLPGCTKGLVTNYGEGGGYKTGGGGAHEVLPL